MLSLFSVTPVTGITTPVKIWRARHWPNPTPYLNDAGLKTINKYPSNNLKQRQLFTDRFGCPQQPMTDVFGNPDPVLLSRTDTFNPPIMLPKTDSYGIPHTDGIGATILVPYRGRKTNIHLRRLRSSIRCGNPTPATLATSTTSHPPSTVVTEIATNPQQSRRLQPQALIDTMTYVYIGAGLATLLLVTGALIFLVLWAQKKKTRQRVNNTDSC